MRENTESRCIIIDDFEKYHSLEELLNNKFNHTVTNAKITGLKMD
ncbi:hypothetical protein JEODO184_00289 [Jeotgalicoccus meleagridis]|uniref:Uncharacterized protein n=1 Tax=Jeotgalicoccus meleagridis TaxID=2759181 RepID=A0A6V7R396_9STAP|nr:hypothetical protein JEODO184_00289 [Jeotgalicoccus meleagridis]